MQQCTLSHPPQHITRIRLLHRSNATFFILGTTGNVYTVTLATTPTCTCPDPTVPCKHIHFLYVHVFSLPLNNPCLHRRTLRPCQLTRLLSTKISNEAVASAPIRRRFHELYRRSNGGKLLVHVEDGSTCPVCLEEFRVGRWRVVACGACKNPIHVVCLTAWKSKSSRTCVICRARWRETKQEDKYLNLSAYVGEDDNMVRT
ncbi:putative transferase transcription factor C2H2 family [Helianthus anomalus]